MHLDADRIGYLLEIGSGNGRFLSDMMALGWHVYGIEPDPRAAKFAKDIYGISLHTGNIESASFPSNHFDAISMNHVIEHIHNPVSLLTECNRVLKPRGCITIITPNIESLGHRIFNKYWRGLEPPRHLNIFSSHSITQCLRRAGFNIEELRTTSRSARGIFVSSILARNGHSYDTSDITWPHRIIGLLFHTFEGTINNIYGYLGEEIYIRGVKT
jgi:SAM-dependent methyltransferase